MEKPNKLVWTDLVSDELKDTLFNLKSDNGFVPLGTVDRNCFLCYISGEVYMKIRLPRIYYILRHKWWSFAARNWRGCEYCNEKVIIKLLGGDVDSPEKPLGNQFNTLLDSVPIGENKKNIACYFYPRRGCIEVTEVDKDMKITPLESIFVSNCPECGRALHKIRFKNKDKKDDGKGN